MVLLKPTWPQTRREPSNRFAQHLDICLPFSEGSDGAAHDFSGYKRDATLQSTASWSVGRYGNQVTLNGSSDYLTTPYNLPTGCDLTMAVVYTPSSLPSAVKTLAGTETGGGSDHSPLTININQNGSGSASSGVVQGYTYASGSYVSTLNNAATLTVGIPQFIVVVLINTVSISLFINGMLQSGQGVGGSATTGSGSPTFRLGGFGSLFLPGSISFAAVWRYALSDGQISRLYQDFWQMVRPLRPTRYAQQAASFVGDDEGVMTTVRYIW